MEQEPEKGSLNAPVLEYRAAIPAPPPPKAGWGTRTVAGIGAVIIFAFYAFAILDEHRRNGDGLEAARRGLPGALLFGSIMACRAITGLSLFAWLRRAVNRP